MRMPCENELVNIEPSQWQFAPSLDAVQKCHSVHETNHRTDREPTDSAAASARAPTWLIGAYPPIKVPAQCQRRPRHEVPERPHAVEGGTEGAKALIIEGNDAAEQNRELGDPLRRAVHESLRGVFRSGPELPGESVRFFPQGQRETFQLQFSASVKSIASVAPSLMVR
jgi:hypothetical protein